MLQHILIKGLCVRVILYTIRILSSSSHRFRGFCFLPSSVMTVPINLLSSITSFVVISNSTMRSIILFSTFSIDKKPSSSTIIHPYLLIATFNDVFSSNIFVLHIELYSQHLSYRSLFYFNFLCSNSIKSNLTLLLLRFFISITNIPVPIKCWPLLRYELYVYSKVFVTFACFPHCVVYLCFCYTSNWAVNIEPFYKCLLFK